MMAKCVTTPILVALTVGFVFSLQAKEPEPIAFQTLTDEEWTLFQKGSDIDQAAFCTAIEQAPQKFLKRENYRYKCKPEKCAGLHEVVTRYRTEHYGRFGSFGRASSNEKAPIDYSSRSTFSGIPIRMNRNVLPAMVCVERKLAEACSKCTPDEKYPKECHIKSFPYQPSATSTLRTRNTFRGDEISNHLFGIAIDLDPPKNTCCGCVKKWREHPKCKKDLELYERMVLPICWIKVFETYGFYWLGKDRLEDTMHFEFLGEPELITNAVRDTLRQVQPQRSRQATKPKPNPKLMPMPMPMPDKP